MRPTDYKPEYPELLLKVFKEGGVIATFCARVEITRSTFYNWIEQYPEFKEAYNLGREHTEDWLTQVGVDGMSGKIEGFNVTAWSMLMRNKCNMTADRKVAIDFTGCKTMNEKIAVLNERVAQGRLTPKEAKDFADYIAIATKIDEATDGKVRLEQVEEALGIKK